MAPKSICHNCPERTVKSGNTFLCERHHRFRQMRHDSSKKKKSVPTMEWLEQNWTLICQDCSCSMIWTSNKIQRNTVSIQHYRDGTLGFVCFSCNSRHRGFPGDMYRDVPKDHRWCKHCKTLKPMTDFYPTKKTDTVIKINSTCKSCSNKRRMQWYRENQSVLAKGWDGRKSKN